jgi:S-formylglutathione hydrolase FrmB
MLGFRPPPIGSTPVVSSRSIPPETRTVPRLLPAALLVSLTAGMAVADDKTPLAFEVTYAKDIHPGPITGRVYVMLGPAQAPRAPRFGPDWFRPQPFFAVDARDWRPGEPLTVGADAAGFPGPLSDLKPGTYAAQAVVRLNPDTHALGDGAGNAYGPVATAKLDPQAGGVTKLTVDKLVEPYRLTETERIKLVDIPSPLLSAFHKRPIRHRAAVILPEGELAAKRPTLYIVPGFGGDLRMVPVLERQSRFGYGRDMIRVLLDPDCGTGHHVFADSANNGPRGRALVEELIPYIEAHYPAIADARARLLNGHSSGGWSTLWLQVTYPDVFGGTWSTSPDPVDFRDFSRIDLYAPGANLFRDAEGQRRPIARMGGKPVLFLEDFSRMEDVVGDGGQMHSFEAVFSPAGPDGRPRPLWDRKTGAVVPEVARAWEAYDIRLVLERNWKTLGPKLAGKIHVITGDEDTFYLEGAAKLLKKSLEALGSDAVVEVVPGKNHFDLLDAALSDRIGREMKAAVAGVGKGR